MLFKDVPLSDLVCPYADPLCDDSCTCCTAHTSDPSYLDSNCTCLLTCPDACTCFHGGSKYVELVTRVLCNDRNLTEFPESIPARATHVRMDGNSFTVLHRRTVSRLTDVVFLNLNNSRIETVEPGSFEGLGSLKLIDLSHNRLAGINETTFGQISSLTDLNLQHNQIQYIHPKAFSGLPALKRLWLNDNWLKEVESFAHFPAEASLALANNPWTCSCEFADGFLKFLISRRDHIVDYFSLRCYWYDDDGVTERLNDSDSSLVHHKIPAGENPGVLDGVSRDSVQHSTPVGENPEALDGVSRKTVQPVSHVGDSPGAFSGVSRPSTLMSKYRYSVLCQRTAETILPAHLDQSSQASSSGTIVTAIIVVLVVAVIAVLVGVVGVWRRREIQALLYVKLGIRLWDDAARLDRQEEEEEEEEEEANNGECRCGCCCCCCRCCRQDGN